MFDIKYNIRSLKWQIIVVYYVYISNNKSYYNKLLVDVLNSIIQKNLLITGPMRRHGLNFENGPWVSFGLGLDWCWYYHFAQKVRCSDVKENQNKCVNLVYLFIYLFNEWMIDYLCLNFSIFCFYFQLFFILRLFKF